MKTFIAVFSLCLAIVSCNPRSNKTNTTWEVHTSNDWLKNKGLINIESIVYDKSRDVFFVTNGKNYKPGTDGFISKIAKDGSLIDLKWVTSLSRPTGMAIYDSILYVADVNALILIDINNGEIIDRIIEPVPNSGLNDVSVNQIGEVFVSASFVHSVFKLENRKLELFLKDNEKLKWANGLFAENNRLLVGGLGISIIDLNTRAISKIDLKPDIKDFEGIAADGQGGYFLTTVENSSLYHFDGLHRVTRLLENDAYFGDLEFNTTNNTLYIPRGNRSTGDFFVTSLSVNKALLTKE